MYLLKYVYLCYSSQIVTYVNFSRNVTSFFAVVFLALVPGLRKHGILQKATSNSMNVIKRLIVGKSSPKPKVK